MAHRSTSFKHQPFVILSHWRRIRFSGALAHGRASGLWYPQSSSTRTSNQDLSFFVISGLPITFFMPSQPPVSPNSDPVALAHANELLAAIVQNSDDGIVSKNLDGTITSWNNAAARIFGYSAEEIVGKSILTIIPPHLHGEEAEIISRIRAGQRVDHYETVRRRKDGSLIEVSITVSPIRNEEGTIIGASKIARDISTRLQMERLLLQSEKLAATGRMAATIAHEINNPLESVVNLIYLAREASPESSEIREYLQTAEREIERVSHIARQTLGFYRDNGLPSKVSLQEVIENTLRVYQRKLEERNIAVITSYPSDSTVVAKKGDLAQVFANIVANAVDAMPKGGTLNIIIEDKGAKFHVALRDTGVGIAAENLNRVFEPFFTTKGDLGTGIGLWVGKQLVEGLGGEISLQSSTAPKEHGTTVLLDIPKESSLTTP